MNLVESRLDAKRDPSKLNCLQKFNEMNGQASGVIAGCDFTIKRPNTLRGSPVGLYKASTINLLLEPRLAMLHAASAPVHESLLREDP